MKKRLFENTWLFPSCILAIFGLIVIFGFSLRAVTLAWSYGLVDAEIPLTPINYEDAIIKTKPELTGGVINYTTPMILLTKEAFYFGETRAFSADFDRGDNKFFVSHFEGHPNLSQLGHDLSAWMEQKNLEQNARIGVFLPSSEIPMPIVIQTLAYLKESELFSRVVMAGGLH
ncbi:MAG: hypothetical protein KBD78_01120 [Oligoflexales bacterium]|nr:hypothetical protein [Oligoflexales bacterium]